MHWCWDGQEPLEVSLIQDPSFIYWSHWLFSAGQGHGGGRRREASGARAEALRAKWWVLATLLWVTL